MVDDEVEWFQQKLLPAGRQEIMETIFAVELKQLIKMYNENVSRITG